MYCLRPRPCANEEPFVPHRRGRPAPLESSLRRAGGGSLPHRYWRCRTWTMLPGSRRSPVVRTLPAKSGGRQRARLERMAQKARGQGGGGAPGVIEPVSLCRACLSSSRAEHLDLVSLGHPEHPFHGRRRGPQVLVVPSRRVPGRRECRHPGGAQAGHDLDRARGAFVTRRLGGAARGPLQTCSRPAGCRLPVGEAAAGASAPRFRRRLVSRARRRS